MSKYAFSATTDSRGDLPSYDNFISAIVGRRMADLVDNGRK